MPLVGDRLRESEVDVLRNWIDEGARPRVGAPPARPNWVARMALTKPALPEGSAPNPVDRFLSDYYRQRKIEPPKPVSDAAFARRAYLDAWGLLPTPEQLAAFTASKDPNKRNSLVREVLADSGNYSEDWMTFFNHLLRNDEAVNDA